MAERKFKEGIAMAQDALYELEKEDMVVGDLRKRLEYLDKEIDEAKRKSKQRDARVATTAKSKEEQALKTELENLESQCRQLEERISEQSKSTAERFGFSFQEKITRVMLQLNFQQLQSQAMDLVNTIFSNQPEYLHSSLAAAKAHSMWFLADILITTVKLCLAKMMESENNLHAIILNAAGLEAERQGPKLSRTERHRLREILRHETKDEMPPAFSAENLKVKDRVCSSGSLLFAECKKRCGSLPKGLSMSKFEVEFSKFADTCAKFAWQWTLSPMRGDLSTMGDRGERKVRYEEYYFEAPFNDRSPPKPGGYVTVIWPVLLDSDQSIICKGFVMTAS